MKRKPHAQDLAALRFMEARSLLRRIGGQELLTLSRDEVIGLAVSLTMSIRGLKGRPHSKDALQRDLAIAARFAEDAPRYRQEKQRGWKGRLELDLSIEFDVDQRTIRRAIDAYPSARAITPILDNK